MTLIFIIYVTLIFISGKKAIVKVRMMGFFGVNSCALSPYLLCKTVFSISNRTINDGPMVRRINHDEHFRNSGRKSLGNE
jgi:hypothetical protein